MKRVRRVQKILDKPACYFNGRHSRLPEQIRVSFEDGTTAIYDLHIEQPEPLFFREMIEVREDIRIGYPQRRTRR